MRRRTAGQVLPLIAISLGALMGFAGISVDVGYLEYRQQAQQSATDAAAIGGAQQMAHNNCANPSGAVSAALADASTNGFTNGVNNVVVTATSPPASPSPFAGNTCAVSVQIATSNVATYFSRLFGYPTGMKESTQAVGTVGAANNGACIYLLSMNTWSSFNSPVNVQALHCAIDINFSADFDGGTIASPYIGYAGNTPNYGGTTFTLASPVPMLPVADPCPQIPGCNYLANNPPPQTNCSGYNAPNGGGTISAGCYTYINGGGGTITMNPGTYVITQNINTNNTNFTGSGVTIYIPSGGNAPNFDNATVNLSPPSSGNTAGVLYYQVPSNTSNPNFNGPNVNMQGLIYCPGAQINYDGNTGNYLVIVAGSANFNGNTAEEFASPPPGGSYIKQAVLGL